MLYLLRFAIDWCLNLKHQFITLLLAANHYI